MKVGINARGGAYCSLILTDGTITSLRKKLENIDDNGEEIIKTIRRPFPNNNGKKWSEYDIKMLEYHIYNYSHIVDIASKMERTNKAIITKLNEIRKFDNISDDYASKIDQFLIDYDEFFNL